ncbi:MAG TPA: class I SAM-dependent methyltransferase, partial [Blastocatellia bacterium]|nr:class I SAM-dependent methyltransferase [Blastocatellia bacterium]
MSQPRFEASPASDKARAQSPYWGEHVARYRFAAPQLTKRSVLDIACGTGYGMPVLQASARSVVGVDIDWEAVRKTQAEIAALGNGRTLVMLADGCRLPFADASFDAVTSFETLEHLENRPQFLAELRRVLSPQGVCILSTPNAHYTQPINGKPRNPYHVYEYTPTELRAELAAHFEVSAMFGQMLDARFTIPPFWDAQQRLPRTPGVQAQLLAWRALNKLPVSLREGTSRAVWGRPFYPADTDYRFDATTVETAPVVVAICRARERAG